MSTVTLTILGNDLNSKFAVLDYPFYLYRLHQLLLEARHVNYFWWKSGIITHLLLQILVFKENGGYLCLTLWYEKSMNYTGFTDI